MYKFESFKAKKLELRQQIVGSLQMIYEIQSELESKKEFRFSPVIKIDDEKIYSFNGISAQFTEELVLIPDLDDYELLAIMRAIELKHYEK